MQSDDVTDDSLRMARKTVAAYLVDALSASERESVLREALQTLHERAPGEYERLRAAAQSGFLDNSQEMEERALQEEFEAEETGHIPSDEEIRRQVEPDIRIWEELAEKAAKRRRSSYFLHLVNRVWKAKRGILETEAGCVRFVESASIALRKGMALGNVWVLNSDPILGFGEHPREIILEARLFDDNAILTVRLDPEMSLKDNQWCWNIQLRSETVAWLHVGMGDEDRLATPLLRLGAGGNLVLKVPMAESAIYWLHVLHQDGKREKLPIPFVYGGEKQPS